ncbi:MAG: SEC-C metal-binding domain-containing protein, partial [Hyphomicrobiales bacterium]
EDDEVYRTIEEKHRAIVRDIMQARDKGQPVLVGTTSIEKSELLADFLKKEKVKDVQVLNARYHEQEASIVSQAGVPGAITIATNMAGRGTDIQLGGNLDMRIDEELGDMPEGDERDKAIAKIEAEVAEGKQAALAAGGLYVIGTERHESRRIDNQLRGRSGRQGDPGRSKFFLSLQDDLMRIFGSDRMDGMLQKLGLKEDESIVHPWINRALEKAQQKVEARNFDIRKNILKFDDVMNDQRRVIFEQRMELMRDEDLSEAAADMRHDVVEAMVSKHIPEKAYAEQWDGPGLQEDVKTKLNLDLPILEWVNEDGIADEEIRERLIRKTDEFFAAKAMRFTPDVMRQVEKAVLLQTLDHLWREHLVQLDHLRQVVGFRGYGQRDPLNEYKAESFELFESLLLGLRESVTMQLAHIELSRDLPEMPEDMDEDDMFESRPDPVTGENVAAAAEDRDPENPESWGKVGRNEACPCGSGKKYKHCHGRFA